MSDPVEKPRVKCQYLRARPGENYVCTLTGESGTIEQLGCNEVDETTIQNCSEELSREYLRGITRAGPSVDRVRFDAEAPPVTQEGNKNTPYISGSR